MNTHENAQGQSQAREEAGQIISADLGPIYLCVVCRERVAIPNQYHCTNCAP
jgi:hypothetical protein